MEKKNDINGSRNSILASIKQNQPGSRDLPSLEKFEQPFANQVEKFTTVLSAIGGQAVEMDNVEEIIAVLKEQYKDSLRVISLLPAFAAYAEIFRKGDDPHKLNDVDVAIIKARFAVAENGAVWVTEDMLHERVLPFICQHLVVLVNRKDFVATMHDAYGIIGSTDYGFATFIAGPSKTADIEQSLVLGAHGPKTMQVFIVNGS